MADDTQLHKDLIRLAHSNPDGIREYLLPLLKKAASPAFAKLLHKMFNTDLPTHLTAAVNKYVGQNRFNGARVEINRGELQITLWLRDDGDEKSPPCPKMRPGK